MIRRHKGFTLIELMLAMAFVSILLLAIAMTAIQAGRLYNRGLVLSSINQMGRSISDTIRRDFLQSAYNPGYQAITVSEGDFSSGRFCTGKYSYLWNSPEVLDRAAEARTSTNGAIVRLSDNSLVNFIRVVDNTGSLCQTAVDGSYPMQIAADSGVTTLLRGQSNDSDVVLSIHSLSIKPLTNEQTREGLYQISFTIGTSALSEINTTDQTCRPPSDDEQNVDFCAINNFDMIVRTNG